jgi:hypothetical protein
MTKFYQNPHSGSGAETWKNILPINTLGTGYLNCLYAYKRKSASPVLNVLSINFWHTVQGTYKKQ